MKHLLLEAIIIIAVAALMLLGVFLFRVEDPHDTSMRSFNAGRSYADARVRELEENRRELAAQLNESEGRVAQWERSCLTGEVPEYYRR
jgi:hypothetical protein